jgi:hypothetical protein
MRRGAPPTPCLAHGPFVALVIAGSALVIGGCTQDPGGDVQLSAGGTTSSDDDGSTGPGGSEVGEEDDTTGAPTGGPCNDDDDCEDDPVGRICDETLGVCGPGCTPNDTRTCYSGPAGTDGVGACAMGLQTCSTQGKWDIWCDGEVVPSPEACGNEIDDDCDGAVDDTDQDGDGFGACSGDCCDVSGGGCSDAELVNPGAFEVEGNDLDDDCDGEIDEASPTCDDGIARNSQDAMDFARALELCSVTEEEPADPADRTWGVISADLSRADGMGAPFQVQHVITAQFGDQIDAEEGASMIALSTGHAADADDTVPSYVPFQPGADLGTASPAPADWLAANGDVFPNPLGCEEPWSADANDSIMLSLRVRAPTNANSFSVRMQFFSAEYPEWVCSSFNDFFVALVDSTADNPADKNIAIYDDGVDQWPVGVNLVMIADGLFTQCESGDVGCAAAMGGEYGGCLGTALLAGTGFDEFDNGCGPSQTHSGGGTGWLTMSGNVTPGEIMDLRLAIWDSSGHIFDSLVLLDDWRWSLDAAQPGVAPG